MTTKTKKILAVICWLAIVVIWNSLHAYHVLPANFIVDRLVDVIITCMGTLILMWVINPDFLKKKENK